jgi:hypothetical protein
LPVNTSLTRLAVPKRGMRSPRESPCWSIKLVHQIGEKVGQRRHASRPSRALIRFSQARLSHHPGLVRRIPRVHELLDQRLGLSVIRVVLNDDQCGLHYTVCASTLS